MKLVFVVGFPRSGTTFLQSLLCTQPGVVSLPETHFFTAVTGPLRKHHLEPLSMSDLHHCTKKLKEMMEFNFSEAAMQDIERKTKAGELHKGNLFEMLLRDFFRQKGVKLTSDTIVVEKTPDHGRKALEIIRYFPEAFFFGIIRHPVDALMSFHEKLIKYRQPFYKLARQWKKTYRTITSLPQGKFRIIRYEDLKEWPEETLTPLGELMGAKIVSEELLNYREKATQLILPHETWKHQNVNGIVDRKSRLIKQPVRFALQLYLHSLMRRWDYSFK